MFIEQYPTTNQTGNGKPFARTNTPTQTGIGQPLRCKDRNVDQLSNADCVTTNANSSQGESQLYIFEDHEAVIKNDHEGQKSCLFHRINLDSKIRIKYVDTKNQLADILTKGSFTRDEWDHRLKLLNIMNFSTSSCSHLLLNGKHSVMSKRGQDRTSKECPAVAKQRPMSLVARSLLSSKKDPPADVE